MAESETGSIAASSRPSGSAWAALGGPGGGSVLKNLCARGGVGRAGGRFGAEEALSQVGRCSAGTATGRRFRSAEPRRAAVGRCHRFVLLPHWPAITAHTGKARLKVPRLSRINAD